MRNPKDIETLNKILDNKNKILSDEQHIIKLFVLIRELVETIQHEKPIQGTLDKADEIRLWIDKIIEEEI